MSMRTIDEMFSRVSRRMEQHAEEIKPFVSWAIESIAPLTRILEIGVRHGGTSQLWCELVGNSLGNLVIGIDWHGADGLGVNGTNALIHSMSLEYPWFCPVIGDSHDLETVQSVKNITSVKPIDLLFIDGDHSYEGVKQDYHTYRDLVRTGGLIAFHDIVDSELMRLVGHGTTAFWEEIKNAYPNSTKEFSINSSWGGIGVLQVW